jgi:tripartite-type tricarboxylate transporter receptor subunit TctC
MRSVVCYVALLLIAAQPAISQAASATSSGQASTASGHAYPVRPIRLIVPYPAGGPTDFVGRTVGQKLSQYLGQQVVVDNRPGAGTLIGSELVARAAPDGYTLLFGTGGGTFLAPLMLPKVPYDPHRDFEPVAMLVMSPQVLVVHPSVPANSVSELIALAKAKPGVLNFASVGTGTSPHLGGELFQSLTGTKIVHVPYKGTAPAMTDLISGQVQMMFTSMPTVLAHVKSGKLRLLGTGGSKRSAAIGDTPPVAETVPGFELVTWYGVFAPARTPDAIVKRLNAEIAKVLADPESRERMTAQGLEPTAMTPDQVRRYTQEETKRWTRLIKAAGIKPTG